MLNRFLLTTVASLFVAVTSNAASLTLVSNKSSYFIGETITLTILGDDQGASSYGVFGRLDYSGALLDNGTRSQITLNGELGPWIRGVLLAGDNGVNAFSYSFNQIAGLYAQSATNLPNVLSTVTLVAVAPGFAVVNWHTTPDGTELDFFGLTSAAGTSFFIRPCDGESGCPVPEPGPGALLVFGLVALGLARAARFAPFHTR